MAKREIRMVGSTSKKGAKRVSARSQADVDLSTYRGRLGASVRARRLKQGLTIQGLVDRLEVAGLTTTATTLYHYEKGRRPIQVDDLPKFAKALSTTIRKLVPES